MGKLVGTLIGMLFGPLGAIFGFMIGAFFDSKVKISTNSFFSTNFFSQNVFHDSFPILAAQITRAGGVDKTSVLITKNIIIELFGKENAVPMMNKYKHFVENGYSTFLLQEACDNILYNVDHQSKIYIISTLLTILKANGTFSAQEVFSIQNISRAIGISGYEFENMLNHFKNGNFRREENANNYSYTYKPDAYKILELNQNATSQEIKKQYRILCKKYHPDLTSLRPKHEQEKSGVKMRQINNAYQQIKKERGFR